VRGGCIPVGAVTSLHRAAKQAELLNLLAFQTLTLPTAPQLPCCPNRPRAGLARFRQIPTKKAPSGWNRHAEAQQPLHSSQLPITTISRCGGVELMVGLDELRGLFQP